MSAPQATETVTRASISEKKVRPTWPLYLLFFGVAGLVGATISFEFLTDSLVALGIPDPGPVTTWGLPFFRAVGWMLAALAIGSFMFAAFYISPKVPGGDNSRLVEAPLSVDGDIAARTGALATLSFGLIALLMIPLTLSDVSGTPFRNTLAIDMWGVAISQVSTALAWSVVAGISLVVGVAGLIFRKWIAQPLLLVGAILTIVPLGMEGHAAAGGAHDYGTNSYLWHLIAMAVWVGGLMALIAHGRRLGPDMEIGLRRYSSVALFALIAMTVSGLINAAVRVEWEDWLTTTYGFILVTKTVGLVLLGFLGFVHRMITIPVIDSKPGMFMRFALVEVILMAAVTGVAITMGRTPPPPPRDPNLSQMAIQMGYDLYEKPTLANVFTMWRFDVMFGAIALLITAGYLYGVWRVHRQGGRWNPLYTTMWLLGTGSLFVTTSSGLGMNMPATYSMHMIVHMILSMVVPLFLVLGGPLTLLMTAYAPGAPGQPGPHDWALAITKAPLLKFLTHPLVNTLQFLFVFYVLYLFIPLYELAISEHAGHLAMNWAFLISGYLYFWELVGVDPTPVRRPTAIRLAWLVGSMPFHLFAGIYLMQLTTVMGEDFYMSLGLPWELDLLQDQRVGGGIGWASGSFPMGLVFLLLFIGWRRDDRATETAYEERVAAGEDQDFEAYNDMLARISAGGTARSEFEEKEFPKAAESAAADSDGSPEEPAGPVLDLRSRRKR
ncbi:MAG: cytochrome c oxidase assembly protein [Corynebacterium sp.]|uniref:cytochrome c oxidase assembly protein n=1 Tax=Corynebacterium sp. TaxID=1720 RepID=UPI0026E10EC0|nr:cytochrome c oxidase assembly protein [Corynebacterium sp.]MDO5669057.1 cytochrome c oxidase assembly protein [Corynebacterium sp.]